jgi:hypothetical protein
MLVYMAVRHPESKSLNLFSTYTKFREFFKKKSIYTSVKAYRGCRGTVSLILNFWARYTHHPQALVTLLLGKEPSTVISALEAVRVKNLLLLPRIKPQIIQPVA